MILLFQSREAALASRTIRDLIKEKTVKRLVWLKKLGNLFKSHRSAGVYYHCYFCYFITKFAILIIIINVISNKKGSPTAKLSFKGPHAAK